MALVNVIIRKYCNFHCNFFLYMFWSRLRVAPVMRGENLCSLKLHVAGWRQQAVAWLQSMVLPRAPTARHCHAGPHRMNWLLDLDSWSAVTCRKKHLPLLLSCQQKHNRCEFRASVTILSDFAAFQFLNPSYKWNKPVQMERNPKKMHLLQYIHVWVQFTANTRPSVISPFLRHTLGGPLVVCGASDRNVYLNSQLLGKKSLVCNIPDT